MARKDDNYDALQLEGRPTSGQSFWSLT